MSHRGIKRFESNTDGTFGDEPLPTDAFKIGDHVEHIDGIRGGTIGHLHHTDAGTIYCVTWYKGNNGGHCFFSAWETELKKA